MSSIALHIAIGRYIGQDLRPTWSDSKSDKTSWRVGVCDAGDVAHGKGCSLWLAERYIWATCVPLLHSAWLGLRCPCSVTADALLSLAMMTVVAVAVAVTVKREPWLSQWDWICIAQSTLDVRITASVHSL